MARKTDVARDFLKSVKASPNAAPLYFIYGEETYNLDLAVDAIIKKAAPDGINDFNYDVFHGHAVNGSQIRSAAETLPMMAGRRIIVVRDVQEMPLQELDALQDYFDTPSPSTCLIFHARTGDKSIDGRNSAIKKLKKNAICCEFATLYENEVGPFIVNKASAKGMQLTPKAQAYLINAVGTNLADLDQALIKIDLYVGQVQTNSNKRLVELDQVQEIIADTRVNSVFDLTNALGQKNLSESLKHLHRILLSGEPALRVLHMIGRHFRILYTLHDPGIRTLPQRDMAQAVRVSPFFLKEYQSHARQFSLQAINDIMGDLLQCDIALKSSRISDKTLLEGLIYKICYRDSAQISG